MENAYFSGIIGHDKIKGQLLRWIGEGRMPHAVIFAGPPGLGKSLMARAVASALVGRPVLEGWDEDTESLLLQDRDDAFYIRPAGAMLKVEQFRLLQEKIMLMGRENANRVCIIDHVETMNKEFANRMLKTLEEPPQGVCFILVTSQADALLPTIVSRCAMVEFDPVGDEEMREGLVRLRGGPPTLYEQPILWGGGNVQSVLELIDGNGLESARYALDFLKIMTDHACPYSKWLTLSAALDDHLSAEILRWTGMLLRDLLVLRSGAPAERMRLRQYEEPLRQMLPQWTDRAVFAGLQVLETGVEALSRHVNTRLAWDYICIQFLHAKGGI